MKRDHISPFFSPCTVDCNYDPLGRAESPTAETRQWSMFHSPGPQNHRTESLGPLDLSGHFTHIKIQENDPHQLDESRNSNVTETSPMGRGDMFSLDQLIQLKKSRAAFKNTNPPSPSPASLEQGRNNKSSLLSRMVNHCCGTSLAKILYCLNPAFFFFVFSWHLYFQSYIIENYFILNLSTTTAQ